jgi:hypothetical protein
MEGVGALLRLVAIYAIARMHSSASQGTLHCGCPSWLDNLLAFLQNLFADVF